MCGIIGYTGKKQAAPLLLQGLEVLEYRGYDSAGIATLHENTIARLRRVGHVAALQQAFDEHSISGTTGIGHTRWATHGKVTEENAHPHVSHNGKVAIVHNGVIENYADIKKELGAIPFSSETDTEVIAELVATLDKGNFFEAVRASRSKLHGRYAFVALHADYPGTLVAVSEGSPLILHEKDGEVVIASDVAALVPHGTHVQYIQSGEMATVQNGNVQVFKKNGELVSRRTVTIGVTDHDTSLQNYSSFMEKEIYEQSNVVKRIIKERIMGNTIRFDETTFDFSQHISHILITGCGTALLAGEACERVFSKLLQVPVRVLSASELLFRPDVFLPGTVVMAYSQSGETAETLLALEKANEHGLWTHAFLNVEHSRMTQVAKSVTYIQAGREYAVASTKAYGAMVLSATLFAFRWAQEKGETIPEDFFEALKRIPEEMQKIFEERDRYKHMGTLLATYPHAYVIGRGVHSTIAKEVALKMKEITYAHIESYPAGELKHGPIALLSKDMPVVALAPEGETYGMMSTSMAEVEARGAPVVRVPLPKTHPFLAPLLHVVPFQLMALEMALALGRNVDRPRNLAKSVTVL